MTKVDAINEKKYSPEEASRDKLFGKMSARHIRRLCEQKRIRAVNVGTRTRNWWKIPESAITEFHTSS